MAKNILVSGAGIAGPTLAYWLTRGGHKVTIIERFPQLRATGQTVDVCEAGLDVVRKMGLEDVIKSKGTKEQGVHFMDANNRPWASFPVGKGFVSDMEILRGELSTILYEHTCKDVEYIFGDSISGIVEKDGAVQANFTKRDSRDFDMLVVAEGLNSRTRDLVFGNKVPIHRLGPYVSYFTIPYAEADGTWSRYHSAIKGRGLWLRPVGDRKTTSAYLLVMSPPTGLEKLDVASQKKEMHKIFADAGWEATRILNDMRETPDFYLQDVAQIKLDSWSKGRVVLLGDSGYCPSPLSGMGTTIAFVGAYVLAGEIIHNSNYQAAFASYESVLRPYVTEIQKIPVQPRFALPQTSVGVRVINLVVALASYVVPLFEKVSQLLPAKKAKKSFELPKYDHL